MDKSTGDLGFGDVKTKRKRERQGKSVVNYLSHQAKTRKNYQDQNGRENRGEAGYGMDGLYNIQRNKCKEFCCIVFCCVDANIYYGEREYGQLVARAEVDRLKTIEEGDAEKGRATGKNTLVSHATQED